MRVIPKFFKRDVIGNLILYKRIIFFLMGAVALFRFKRINNAVLSGTEHVNQLPKKNVLFVSNHQTYFADVSMMLLALFSIKNGFRDKIGSVFCLFNPNPRIYFIAAAETMKNDLLTKVLGYAGGILIKRTWREKGKAIKREVDFSDTANIGNALKDGWVITFPQGTTKPYAPGRKGTAHLIKQYKPVVIPVTIDGFRRAFDKKGLVVKKKGVDLKMTFKAPLNINYDAPVEEILDQVMNGIEQTTDFISPSIRNKVEEKEADS